MRVALVSTLRNEEEGIRAFLDSILSQTRTPDSIIITDGGSTDGTCGTIQALIDEGHPIRLIRLPGANRSVGRNTAIREADADVVAVTDAGCSLSPDWLERITAPFADGADAVAGFYLAAPETPAEAVIGAMTIPGPGSVDPKTFLPSSRSVAFTKEAWERAGGYPEHLNLNEDTPFDLRLLTAGYRFAFRGDAIVHWRPRRTPGEVYGQFLSYARGDGQAGILHGTYGAIYLRNLLLLLGIASLLAGAWPVAVPSAVPTLHRAYRDASKVMKKLANTDWSPWECLPWVLPVRVAIDAGDMVGYALGLLDRRRNGWSPEGKR